MPGPTTPLPTASAGSGGVGRADTPPEPLTTGASTGLSRLTAAGGASAAAGPLEGLPFAEPARVVSAVRWSAACDAASAGPLPVAPPSVPSPGVHDGACTRL